MAGVLSSVYNSLVRRNPVFLTVIFGSAFGFEILFDRGFDRLWDGINKGRQWKDIRSRYVEEAESE